GQPAGRIAATFYQESDGKAGAPAKRKSPTAPNSQDGVMGSFKLDPAAPMDIEADTLDVYDGEKRAVFHGNVKSKQGDFLVRTVELIAFYTGQTGLLATGGEDTGNRQPSQLTRVECKQKVLVTSKDGQSASGDWAIFDTTAHAGRLGGDVTVARGKDGAQGQRLKIDLTPGISRFEVDRDPAVAQPAPATIASPPLTAPAANPAERACAPGRQC